MKWFSPEFNTHPQFGYKATESMMQETDRHKILKFYEKYMLLIGISGHFMFVFQTFKIISNKSAADVSLVGCTVAFLSMLSWLFYGTLRRDRVLILVNIFGATVSLICIITIIFMDR